MNKLIYPSTFVIMPVQDACNIKCKYCNAEFLRMQRFINEDKVELIDLNLLEILFKKIKKIFPLSSFLQFHFYGGEPLLAGIKFYNSITKLEKKHLWGFNVINTLNTNGLLLNEKWLKFFKQHDFILSISLDGSSYLHNSLRFPSIDTYRRVVNNIYKIKNEKLLLRIQLVVHRLNYQDVEEIFYYFKDELKIDALGIIPCFNKINPFLEYIISPQQYGKFLISLFKLWIENKMPFSCNLFKNIIVLLKNRKNFLCYFTGKCHSVNIDNKGNVYVSCEVQSGETLIGNLKDLNFLDLVKINTLNYYRALKTSELLDILDRNEFKFVRNPAKKCFQYTINSHYFFLEAIWMLYNYVKEFFKNNNITL